MARTNDRIANSFEEEGGLEKIYPAQRIIGAQIMSLADENVAAASTRVAAMAGSDQHYKDCTE